MADDLSTMALHDITETTGEDGLRERFAIEVAALPAGVRPRLLDALAWAADLHRDDRRSREPYLNHLLRVAIRVAHHYRVTDPDVICAALLHDAVEDHAADIAGTVTEALGVVAARFGPRVASLVAAVTNPEYDAGSDPHEQYRDHVLESLRADPWARVIKLSDFTDNAVGIAWAAPAKARKVAPKYYPLVGDLRELVMRADTPLDDDVKHDIDRQLVIGERRLIAIVDGAAAGRLISANGVALWADTFGDAGDPAIVLVAGSGASMDWWEPEFCRRLAAGGRFVIRYDHRDTGQSVSYETAAPLYSFHDLVLDIGGVLDAFAIAAAHVVGISMGGALAQLAALDMPGRVRSVTLISTSPGPGSSDLPEMLDRMHEEHPAKPDWDDHGAVIDYIVAAQRRSAAMSTPFDEDEVRDIATRAVARTINLASSLTNHMATAGSGLWRRRLGTIEVPALVIHGTEDPLFPPAHATALAAEIPGARLLLLEGTGHELPRRVWDTVIPAILSHTAA